MGINWSLFSSLNISCLSKKNTSLNSDSVCGCECQLVKKEMQSRIEQLSKVSWLSMVFWMVSQKLYIFMSITYEIIPKLVYFTFEHTSIDLKIRLIRFMSTSVKWGNRSMLGIIRVIKSKISDKDSFILVWSFDWLLRFDSEDKSSICWTFSSSVWSDFW